MCSWRWKLHDFFSSCDKWSNKEYVNTIFRHKPTINAPLVVSHIRSRCLFHTDTGRQTSDIFHIEAESSIESGNATARAVWWWRIWAGWQCSYPNPVSCMPGCLCDSSPHARKKSRLIPVGSLSKQRTMPVDFLWELQVWPEDLGIPQIDNVSRLRYGVSF